MNAVAVPSVRAAGVADAIAALRVSTSRRHQVWLLVTYAALLLAAGALAVLAPGTASRSNLTGMFAAMANFALWAGLFGRLVLLRGQATHGCMPGVAAATRTAVAIGVALTLLLPGTLLLAAGFAPVPAFGTPAIGALAGLLFVLMPSPLAAALCVAPGVVGLTPRETLVRAERAIGIELFSMSSLPLLILVGTLAATWYWSRVARITDPGAIPRWRRPMVLFDPMNAMGYGATQTDADHPGLSTHSGWLAPVIRSDTAGPHSPQASISAVLAGPMGQVTPRQAVKEWALVALAITAVLLTPFPGESAFLRDALLLGGLIGLLGGGWTLALRLDRRRQRQSGEFVELALLPGLGDPARARRLLQRGVLRRIGQLMGVALAAALLLAWVIDAPSQQLALIVLMLAGAAAGSWLMCLVALAGTGLGTLRMGLVMLPLLLATASTLMIVMLRIPIGASLPAWSAGWVLLICAYLAAARVSLRTFQRRAHAFLVD
ncbi:hypothetical protein [Luteimonas terrae]|uniref:ABC transporter permease n=1 Tax=Luteimonas terrae TaxID=1530191 RepID=A0ABU1Y196_9GAMM|nr:hypothetical protein [Luteimonas terrae]MDR7194793.1 hypothetical protein [Luteimonas terrae]